MAILIYGCQTTAIRSPVASRRCSAYSETMRGPRQKLATLHRGLAALAILVFVLSPACSLICQTQTCHPPAAADHTSGCNHPGDATPSSTQFAAAGKSCGLVDLLFALPNPQTDKQLLSNNSSHSLVTGLAIQDFGADQFRGILASSISRTAEFSTSPGPQSLTALRI
jgi:hypothetical protein